MKEKNAGSESPTSPSSVKATGFDPSAAAYAILVTSLFVYGATME